MFVLKVASDYIVTHSPLREHLSIFDGNAGSFSDVNLRGPTNGKLEATMGRGAWAQSRDE